MKKWLGILAVIMTVIGSAGCNTIEGMGKDIKKGGEAIERAAK